MDLYITNQATDPMYGTRVPPEMLCNNSAHLVIASVRWAEAWVEVSESISEGCLTRLPSKCNVIHAQVPDKPSRHQMILLCELYPELAGKIRKAFMKGEGVHGILPGLWREGDSPGREPMPLPNSE